MKEYWYLFGINWKKRLIASTKIIRIGAFISRIFGSTCDTKKKKNVCGKRGLFITEYLKLSSEVSRVFANTKHCPLIPPMYRRDLSFDNDVSYVTNRTVRFLQVNRLIDNTWLIWIAVYLFQQRGNDYFKSAQWFYQSLHSILPKLIWSAWTK